MNDEVISELVFNVHILMHKVYIVKLKDELKILNNNDLF